MDFGSNSSHLDNAWSSPSGIIYLKRRRMTTKMRTMARTMRTTVVGVIVIVVVVVVARCAVTIIVDFVARRAVAPSP
jgi:hypothetical protein